MRNRESVIHCFVTKDTSQSFSKRVVRNYSEELNSIQTNVFNRDGPVATSLRSWALNTISIRASEYLILLNTKIQRILLKEKTRDVIITCFSKKEVLDLESLSGGEQQRIDIARALLNSPKLILADEPTGNLDPETSDEIMQLLFHICRDFNTTIVMATHDYMVIKKFPARTIKTESGRVWDNASIAML